MNNVVTPKEETPADINGNIPEGTILFRTHQILGAEYLGFKLDGQVFQIKLDTNFVFIQKDGNWGIASVEEVGSLYEFLSTRLMDFEVEGLTIEKKVLFLKQIAETMRSRYGIDVINKDTVETTES